MSIGGSASRGTKGDYSVSLGALASRDICDNNTICRNASGTSLNTDRTSRCYIKPIRTDATSGRLALQQYNIR